MTTSKQLLIGLVFALGASSAFASEPTSASVTASGDTSEATDAQSDDDTGASALPRLTIFAEGGSFYLISRATVAADFRVISFADDWVHVMANAGIGATSFFFGPPNLDVHATAGALFFPGRHHLEIRAGGIAVSNSVAGDGPYLLPLVQVGYRYFHSTSPLALTMLLGTTGATVGVGLAF